MQYIFILGKISKWLWFMVFNATFNNISVPIAIKVVSSNTAHGRGVLNTTLYDKVCQWLGAGWWFSPGTPVSSTNKTDRHDITEILFTTSTCIVRLEDICNALRYSNQYLFLCLCNISSYWEKSPNGCGLWCLTPLSTIDSIMSIVGLLCYVTLQCATIN
jgi:hypothetical protein